MSGIGSSAMVFGTGSSATGVGVIGTSPEHHWMLKDLHTGDHETRQADRLFICVTKGVTEVMPRKLFFHFRKSNVVSSCFDNSIALTNPYVSTTFVSNDNPWTQPTHGPPTLSLVIPTPIHHLVTDCKTNL